MLLKIKKKEKIYDEIVERDDYYEGRDYVGVI